MDTQELIAAVREQSVEFDQSPITDEAILRRINFAYNYAYGKLVKGSDAMYAKHVPLHMEQGKSEYDMPRALWGKRVEDLLVPTPPQTGYRPYSYVSIDKRDPQSLHRYDSPRINTLLPMAWGQIRNKIIVVPAPRIPFYAKLLVTPTRVPLGILLGRVTDFVGGKITLDRTPGDTLIQSLSVQYGNFVSICDGLTGELKAIYAVDTIDGFNLILGTSARTKVSEEVVRSVVTRNIWAVNWLSSTAFNEYMIDGHGLGYAVGDIVELKQTCEANTYFNTSDKYGALTSTSYAVTTDVGLVPPILKPGNLGIDGTGVVIDVQELTVGSGTKVSFVRIGKVGSYPLTNGYPKIPGSGQVLALAASTAPNIVRSNAPLTGADASTFRALVTFAGTGIVALDGNTFVCDILAAATTTFTIYANPALAIGTGPLGGTATIVQMCGQFAIPPIKEATPQMAEVAIATISTNTPLVYAALPERTDRDIEGYDHVSDLAMDDVVCAGWATGIPLIPEEYHELLAQYAILTLKSSLNESDSEVAALLKEMFSNISGDSMGRKEGRTIRRDFGTRSSYSRTLRRMSRG